LNRACEHALLAAHGSRYGGTPTTDKAVQPQNFARPDGELNLASGSGVQTIHLQHRFDIRDCAARWPLQYLERVTNHQGCHLVRVRFGDAENFHKGTVSQYHDPVGDIEDLLHTV
jgi:hypothetical protein